MHAEGKHFITTWVDILKSAIDEEVQFDQIKSIRNEMREALVKVLSKAYQIVCSKCHPNNYLYICIAIRIAALIIRKDPKILTKCNRINGRQ